MKKGLLLLTGLLILLQGPVFGQRCIKALTDAGQEVDIICTGDNITFVDCGPNPDPTKTYYEFDDRDGRTDYKIAGTKHQYTSAQAGTAIVLQNVNPVGGGTGDTISKKYLVINPIQPAFTTRLCGNNRVEVLLTDQNFRNYTIAWGDGITEPIAPNTLKSHIYVAAGTSYTIKVSGQDMNVNQSYLPANPRISCEQSNSRTITTLPQVQPPVFTAMSITNFSQSGQLSVSFGNAQPEYKYVLEHQNASGSYDFVDTLRAASAGTYTASANTTLAQCYRIRVTDNCNSSNLAFSANTICSVPLTVQAANRQNILSWPVYLHSGFQNFEITRNNALVANPTIVQTSTNMQFTDTAVICGTAYTYQVKAILANNVVSTSNQSTVTATATVPPSAPGLQASFNAGNKVELAVTPPAQSSVQQVTFNRQLAGGTPAKIGESPNLTFTDVSLADLNRQPCYQVIFRDNCSLQSAPSRSVCPVILTGTLTQSTITSPASATVQWTAYNGFDQNPTYELEKITATGSIISLTSGVINNYTDTNIDPDYQLAVYRVKVTDPVSGQIVYSNTLTLVQKFQIHLPNAFTPNNDGLNDIFEVKGRFISTFNLRVVDRWGMVVFESKDPAIGWDGKINGKPAPTGAYGYTVNATDLADQNLSKNGTVTILK